MKRMEGTAKRENAWCSNAKRLAILAVIASIIAAVLSGCGAISSSSKDAASPAASVANSGSAANEKMTIAADSTAKAKMAAEAGAAAPAAAGSLPQAKADANAQQSADSFNGSGANAVGAVDRKIVYRANLTMQVEKYAESQAQIEEAVSRSGGYVLQFSENESSYEKSGTYVIKVPASGFSSLLSQLEKMNPSAKKSVQGQDVSEEFVDLTSRLKAKQVVESRLIMFMEKASKTDELLSFSTELGKVQEEIERIKGRMRYLEQNVAYSTIEVRMTQKLGSAAVINGQDRGPLFQRAADALNASAAVMALVFQWIVVALAAILPVVLVLAVIGIPIWLLRRSRNRKLVEIRKRLTAENDEPVANVSKKEN